MKGSRCPFKWALYTQGGSVRIFKFIFLALFFNLNSINASENKISIAQSYSIDSKVMNEQRKFAVYLPPSYETTKVSYPVIYVLDGDWHRLKAVSGIVEALSTDTLENQINESIIVAIPNSESAVRERDFTPTNVDWIHNGKVLEKFENIGNADNYILFFENELIPLINSKYRTSNKRIIIGESFGGLFAAHTLLMKPSLFSDYLIIDATYLWDNNYLNRMYDDIGYGRKPISATVYLSFANNHAFGEIGETNFKWGQEFSSKLKSKSSLAFKFKSQYFENESHGTVALPSWYNGLLYLNAK